ncbi:hypothetical protein F5Y18DRAFT_414607 [Xylariaceae sp. FL1019]|nr:hypothetical protein F5Y18DRAFT_414607 [Xylariaceae sp. FL1019]
MSQPQSGMPPRQFSPPQGSPSPTNAAPSYGLGPNKRPKLSPQAPAHPISPYQTSQSHVYAGSPSALTPGPLTPTAGLPSPIPQSANVPNAPQAQHHAYTMSHQQPNGRSPSVGQTHVPQSSHTTHNSQHVAQHSLQHANQPVHSTYAPHPHVHLQPAPPPQQTQHYNNQSHPTTPIATQPPAQYSNATLMPNNLPGAGNMGPPMSYPSDSRQTAKGPPKTSSYDVNDMLMGTGIDLDEEFEYQNDPDALRRSGYPPQGRDSFYGAGPANQPAKDVGGMSQDEYAARAADEVWDKAAHDLAVTRQQEVRLNFITPGRLHKRMADTAHKHGLSLNTDLRPDGKGLYMGKFVPPADFPKPEIKMMTQTGPGGAIVQTAGSFIPKDSFLVDQIALLSIATREHLKDLLTDANDVAISRQTSSHGFVPPEWMDVADVPAPKVNGSLAEGPRIGADSAVSPGANPLKRSSDQISNDKVRTSGITEIGPNHLVESVVGAGKQTQDGEEGRLKKRQKRVEKGADKEKEGGEAGSRSGSIAPGTPGGLEGGEAKLMTKKEGKKAAAKAAENASSTTVNTTLSLFTGGKKKKYSWMTSGADAGSGASTPKGTSKPGLGGSGSIGAKTARGPLTKPSVSHLGQFREDGEKGKNIQLRDWVIILEDRKTDPHVLQSAYDQLDKSDTGDKVGRPADKTK